MAQSKSAEVRRMERITPLAVLLDELASLVLPESLAKALDRNHPEVIEANERSLAREIIQMTLGKLAHETRFVGIFLHGVQRPDANILGSGGSGGGEFRSNLTSADVKTSKVNDGPAVQSLGDQDEPPERELTFSSPTCRVLGFSRQAVDGAPLSRVDPHVTVLCYYA